jgi:hypothetical protein
MATLPNAVENQASIAFKVIPSNTINIPQPYVSATGASTSFIGATLIDGGANFQGVGTSVPQILPGDTVYNDTTNTIATVVSVDSNTQLTLSATIFLAVGDDYTIYQGNPEPNSFLLYVGTTGDVSIQTSMDQAVILKNVGNASFIPIGVGRVNTLGTTASDIVALI